MERNNMTEGRSTQISAEMQYGQWYQYGGDS